MYTLKIIAYCAFYVFVVNDAVKYILIKRSGMIW